MWSIAGADSLSWLIDARDHVCMTFGLKNPPPGYGPLQKVPIRYLVSCVEFALFSLLINRYVYYCA